jgi:hypothetical protein
VQALQQGDRSWTVSWTIAAMFLLAMTDLCPDSVQRNRHCHVEEKEAGLASIMQRKSTTHKRKRRGLIIYKNLSK